MEASQSGSAPNRCPKGYWRLTTRLQTLGKAHTPRMLVPTAARPLSSAPRAGPLTCVVMTRPLPWWPITRLISAVSTTASLVVRPGASTLVESDMNSATPSRPKMSREVVNNKARCSGASPRTG